MTLLVALCCLAPTQAQDAVNIPLEFGTRIAIFRGNDTPTHVDEWNKYAFDFVLPVGSPVYAAASGTVVVVKEDSTGPTGNWRDNNQIAILHEDGFAGLYEHLKKDGVAVVVGQQVLAGDLIGWSGNTGNSEGPHLHFVMRGWQDILKPAVPTKFLEVVQNGGVPKTNEVVVSRNFPIREIVGDLADLIELYEVCADADAREALAPELGRISREKMPETVRRRIAAVKDRSDLRAIYDRWRKKLLDRVETELTSARDRLTTLRAGGSPESIHRLATLALRDFPFCDQARDFEATARDQKKALGPHLADPELDALLKHRSAVTAAVRAELKWRGSRKGLDQPAPPQVRTLFEAAIKLAPSEEARMALKRHLESPPFRAAPESRPGR